MSNSIEDFTGKNLVQYATFHCGESLFGIEIGFVQEINRNQTLTQVPLSQPCLRGVINLRGEVVTLLDLRILMGLTPTPPTKRSRNLVIKLDGEVFGLWVDAVADIFSVDPSNVLPPPSNLTLAESRLIKGVHQGEKSLVMIVDPREILTVSLNSNSNRSAA